MTTTYKNTINKTPSAKSISASERKFLLVDASNMVVGRLASEVALLLRGKRKTTFTPHSDVGDFVIIINSDHVKFTSNKMKSKIYYRHTGYPGGIKSVTPSLMIEKGKSNEIIKKAIKGMLPKGPLGTKLLANLRVYCGSEQYHAAQQPVILDIASQNRKNLI